jgi:hypothetical protein
MMTLEFSVSDTTHWSVSYGHQLVLIFLLNRPLVVSRLYFFIPDDSVALVEYEGSHAGMVKSWSERFSAKVTNHGQTQANRTKTGPSFQVQTRPCLYGP